MLCCECIRTFYLRINFFLFYQGMMKGECDNFTKKNDTPAIVFILLLNHIGFLERLLFAKKHNGFLCKLTKMMVSNISVSP